MFSVIHLESFSDLRCSSSNQSNLIQDSLNYRRKAEVQVNTEALFLTHSLSFGLLSSPGISFISGDFYKMDTFATSFLVYTYGKQRPSNALSIEQNSQGSFWSDNLASFILSTIIYWSPTVCHTWHWEYSHEQKDFYIFMELEVLKPSLNQS